MKHCVDNSSYQGCDLPKEKDDFHEDPVGKESDLGWKEEDCPQPFNEVESEEEPTNQAEEFPKPVFDEGEWSDGWK